MADGTIKILVVDDIESAKTFFDNIFENKGRFIFEPVYSIDRLVESIQEHNPKLLLVNAHIGSGRRWKFGGVDLVWSMRGCARESDAIGIQNSALLTLPVILYSVLDQKYLVAYSIHECGQNIFDIPYVSPLCGYVCLAQSKQRIQAILSQKILELLSLRCDAVDIGIDVYHTRLKLLTECFVDQFRHDVRNPLQDNRAEDVERALHNINGIIEQIDQESGGIDLTESHLSDVVKKIQRKLEPFVSNSQPVSLPVKDKIVRLQESVIHLPHLFSLYAANISSFLNPNLPQKTGIMIIEDEGETAGDYQRKLVRRMGFVEDGIELVTQVEDHHPNQVIEKIKEKQKESICIEVAIVDLMLRGGLRGGDEAGIEILRKIKFEFPRIRIVVISGRNDRQFEALSHGADYYITKPIQDWEQDFCSIIREALYWKRVLLLETEQTHRENLRMVEPFRRSCDGIKSEEQKYTEILRNITDYFASHWIKLEPYVIESTIPDPIAEKIEDGRYDLILLDSFAEEAEEWEQGKRLFKHIRKLHQDVPILILASTGIGAVKNKLIFHELKHHFRIDYDNFWVKPLSFERLRQIKEIFQQQGLIKYDVRYTLLLPKKHSRQADITPEQQQENESIKRNYLKRTIDDFGGATVWEGEGYWWDADLVKDDQYILHILTRYAPGNRGRLLKIIEDYGKETGQKAIFLQEERVNTYEKRPGG